jgi:hypothetical protein
VDFIDGVAKKLVTFTAGDDDSQQAKSMAAMSWDLADVPQLSTVGRSPCDLLHTQSQHCRHHSTMMAAAMLV